MFRYNSLRSALSLLLVAGTAASCTRVREQEDIPWGAQAVGMKLCNASHLPIAKYVMRIYLDPSLNDLFGAPGPSRNVRYDAASAESAGPLANDFNPAGGHANTSSDTTVRQNPFHSDLTTVPGVLRGDIFEYRVILNNDPHNVTPYGFAPNVVFYYEADPKRRSNDIRGVAASTSSKSKLICSNSVKLESMADPKSGEMTSRDVADFYVRYAPDDAAKSFDSFNIAVAAKTGAADTPILIDAKMLNRG
jgi:hypothetical protein